MTVYGLFFQGCQNHNFKRWGCFSC